MGTQVYIRAKPHVERAEKRATAVAAARREGKTHPAAGMDVIADEALKGLRIITVNGVSSWVVKTSTHTKTLGYIYPRHDWPLTAPEEARELGGRVKAMLRTDPQQVDAYLDHRHAGKSHEEALAALVAKPDTWTLRKCFEETIKDKQHPNSTEKIGEAQAADLNITMNRACFQAVLDKPAAVVTPEDIEEVRDQIVREAVAKGQKGVSPSIKFVTHVRTVMNYCASHQRKSGLNPERPWWQLVKAKFKNPKRERKPELEDIVKTMLLAEEYLDKPLPGRAIDKEGVRSGTLAGLWWLVLTDRARPQGPRRAAPAGRPGAP